MSELIKLNIDLSRVSKYKKLSSDTETFLDQNAVMIVPSLYHDQLLTSLNNLLKGYKVSGEHLDYFLFIVGQHFLLYQTILEQKKDALESNEPLRFIEQYLIQTEFINSKAKTKELANTKLNSRSIELVYPGFKSDIRLHNTDLVVRGIYQLFKSQYTQPLKELLRPYNDMPPLKIISQLVKENNYLIQYATHYFIPEIVTDILDYLNTHLSGQLVRKQYLFIFDLIFLCGVFTLEDDQDTQEYDLTTEFKIPFYPSTEKTGYVTKILQRYRKYIRENP